MLLDLGSFGDPTFLDDDNLSPSTTSRRVVTSTPSHPYSLPLPPSIYPSLCLTAVTQTSKVVEFSEVSLLPSAVVATAKAGEGREIADLRSVSFSQEEEELEVFLLSSQGCSSRQGRLLRAFQSPVS